MCSWRYGELTMKQYKGEWLELGPSHQDGAAMRYNYVKVNDDVINNLRVMPHLNAVLRDQVRKDFSGNVTLWVSTIFFKKTLVGVTMADGQVYRQGLGAPYTLLVLAFICFFASVEVQDRAFKMPWAIMGIVIFLFAGRIVREVWKVKDGRSA